MVLAILVTLGKKFYPTQYTTQILIAAASILVLYSFFQGRKTNRERDLHGRVILITGAFTPVGLTLFQQLAERGAHIIALTSFPVSSDHITALVDILRSTTKNELIYAEHCDLDSPASIQAFCKRFLQGEDKRLDALIFGHEYESLGSFGFVSRDTLGVQEARDRRSLATFLLTTLLLPSLLTAPSERDIRIINIVNRFYAAAAPHPSRFYPNLFPSLAPTSSAQKESSSLFFAEGSRALKTIILTRHLQRILDALPSAQAPKAEAGASTIPVVNSKNQKSNIVAVTVSPGVSRSETIGKLLCLGGERRGSWIGILSYILLYPLLRITTKGAIPTIQSILHTLFLPTPFKILSTSLPEDPSSQSKKEKVDVDYRVSEEVLRPGALYAECATVVGLKISPPPVLPLDKKSETEKTALQDDHEFGGVMAGIAVWEAYEVALKEWQKSNPSLEEYEKEMKERSAEASSSSSSLPTVVEEKEE